MSFKRINPIMETSTEIVTPQLAAEWLNHNRAEQRKVRARLVRTYAEAMNRGEWTLTGGGITFDVNGDLTNGQHTLSAIIVHGRALTLRVTVGEPVEAFHFTDIGKPRSVTDSYGIPPSHAAVAKFLCVLGIRESSMSFTNAEVKKVYDAFEYEIEMLFTNCSTTAKTITTAPVRTAVVILMATLDNHIVEILDEYRWVVEWDFKKMSNCSAVLIKQLTEKSATHNAGFARVDPFLRAMKAFHPDNRDKKTLSIGKGFRGKTLKEAKELVLSRLSQEESCKTQS